MSLHPSLLHELIEQPAMLTSNPHLPLLPAGDWPAHPQWLDFPGPIARDAALRPAEVAESVEDDDLEEDFDDFDEDDFDDDFDDDFEEELEDEYEIIEDFGEDDGINEDDLAEDDVDLEEEFDDDSEEAPGKPVEEDE